MGNPLNDGTRAYTWEHGRQLASLTMDGVTWNYTYNADGMRTQRTNGQRTYTYTYNGDKLTYMTVDGYLHLYFAYDASGVPMSVTYNGTTYYYVTNVQGDVIGILDSTGAQVATYAYDAWGNPLPGTESQTSEIGTLNPLRYRSYVYDSETKLYYLQSRYYNPETGRFINADAFASTGQGLLGNNMFAYCTNNPIAYIDPDGLCRETGYKPWLSVTLSRIDCKRSDCPTSSCYVPDSVDITDELNSAMLNNSEELAEYRKNNSFSSTVNFFVNKVKPGGDWDFKAQDDWSLASDIIYVYNGEHLRYDDIGNIHYGYVGRVIFNTDMLLLAGGCVQIYTKTSSWDYWSTNFDDPRDQWAIQFGCDLWDMGGL